MMLSGRMHRPSMVWTVPEAPYLWNVHFVTLEQVARCQHITKIDLIR